MKSFIAAAFLVGCVAQADAPSEEVEQGASSLATCPTSWTRHTLGTRELALSNEASGLAASRKNAGVLWTHDDSGDSARVFAMSYAGAHLGVYDVSAAGARVAEGHAGRGAAPGRPGPGLPGSRPVASPGGPGLGRRAGGSRGG